MDGMTTTLQTAVTTAETLLAEGRLARRKRRTTLPDGGGGAGVWVALGGKKNDHSAFAALGISEPLARLILWLDCVGSEEAWRPRMARLLALLRRTPVLTPKDWTVLDYAWRRLAVEEAMRHTEDERALAIARSVAALCARAEAGEPVAREEWYAAWAAAHGASVAYAPWAEAGGAWGMWDATQAVTSAASWATEVGADIGLAAAMAVAWATTATGEAWAPTADASQAAADRLADAILDALEERITAREGA